MKYTFCATCLATDRNLITLGEFAIFDILKYLLVQKRYNELKITDKVCWECFAQLNNVRRFQNKAFDSLRILQGYCNEIENHNEITNNSQTTLGITKLKNINIHYNLNNASDEKYDKEDILELDQVATKVKLEEYGEIMFRENDVGICIKTEPLNNVDLETELLDDECKDDVDIDVSTIKNDNKVLKDEQSMIEVKLEDPLQIRVKDFGNIQQVGFDSPCGEVDPTWRQQMLPGEQLSTREGKLNKTCHYEKMCKKRSYNEVTKEFILTEDEHFACTSAEVYTNIGTCSSTKLPPKEFDFKPSFKKKKTYIGEDNLETRITKSIAKKQLKFKCNLCEYKTTCKYMLVRHIRIHTGEKPFKCELCEYKAATKSTLVNHIRAHTGEKPYKCKLCNYKAANNSALVKHIHTHTGEKPFKCELCDYKATEKGALVRHIRIHTGEEPYKCELCNYKSTIKRSLVNHFRTHTGEKPFKCEHCDFKAAIKGTLVNHIRIHTGEKPFKCELCDYKATIKRYLINHIRTHTGEKPFKCELCDYKAVEKGALVTHIRTHTGEKPFKCELCDYKAVEKGALVRHIRTHTGEKPFKCELCDYKAATKSNLSKHIRTHTSKKTY